MNLSRSLTLFAILAAWLIATQHCVLEASGVWDAVAGKHHVACCNDGTQHTAAEMCNPAEEGSVASANTSVKVPTPDFAVCLYASLLTPFDLPLAGEQDTLSKASPDCPLDWVPSWHFERRAAPPSRAPSQRIA